MITGYYSSGCADSLANDHVQEGFSSASARPSKADREKRAGIFYPEGLHRAAILKAEGERNAEILSAEANKAAVLETEGRWEDPLHDAQAQERTVQAEADDTRMVS